MKKSIKNSNKLEDIDPDYSKSKIEINNKVSEAVNITKCNVDNIEEGYDELKTGLEDMLSSMIETHKNIDYLIAEHFMQPRGVDAVFLARYQLEFAFVILLLIDNPSKWWSIYQQEGWQNWYLEYLKMKEGYGHISRFKKYLDDEFYPFLEAQRQLMKIPLSKKNEIEKDKIPRLMHFPTMNKKEKYEKHLKDKNLNIVIEKLEVLFQVQSYIFHPTYNSLVDKTSMRKGRNYVSTSQLESMFEVKIVHNSLIASWISMLMACSEIAFKISEPEPRIKVGKAWILFNKISLLGKNLYNLRYKEKLGIIS